MPPAVFDLIDECIYQHIKKEVTNFRKPLQVGLKLTITLRPLATESVWNPDKQSQGPTRHNGERPKVVRDIVLTCVVLYNMTDQGRVVKAPIPADDKAAIANEPAVYVPDENHWNPWREAKHQRDLLKDYFSHVGALGGQEGRIWDVTMNYSGERRGWHLSVLFRTI